MASRPSTPEKVLAVCVPSEVRALIELSTTNAMTRPASVVVAPCLSRRNFVRMLTIMSPLCVGRKMVEPDEKFTNALIRGSGKLRRAAGFAVTMGPSPSCKRPIARQHLLDRASARS